MLLIHSQAAEEEEAAEQLLLQQQQELRSRGSKGVGAFQPWRGTQGGPAEPRQDPLAGSPEDESKSLGFDLRPKVSFSSQANVCAPLTAILEIRDIPWFTAQHWGCCMWCAHCLHML